MAGSLQSQRKEVQCAVCGRLSSYFKLIESWRPDHAIDDPMTIAQEEGNEPASRRRGRRICPLCELECRKNEWPSLTEAEWIASPNYCTYERVY
eukprot:8346628-Prorocentrum_lima.AAC.1